MERFSRPAKQGVMALIVDDDPVVLETARDLLGPDWNVFFASSGRQALKLAKEVEFSVVLIDIVLAEENALK